MAQLALLGGPKAVTKSYIGENGIISFKPFVSAKARGKINELLGKENVILKYGITSFLSANLINNIPMSVLFCPIIEGLTGSALTGAVYATIIGSNLGALLTPIGALAGIMWSSMLKKHEVKYSYTSFIKNYIKLC